MTEPLRQLLADYDGEPVCPRCGNGLPNCAVRGFTHQETCAQYRTALDTCSRCTDELTAEFEGNMDGWFVNDQPSPVGVLALIAAGCWVAVGIVCLGVAGAARAVWRWAR